MATVWCRIGLWSGKLSTLRGAIWLHYQNSVAFFEFFLATFLQLSWIFGFLQLSCIFSSAIKLRPWSLKNTRTDTTLHGKHKTLWEWTSERKEARKVVNKRVRIKAGWMNMTGWMGGVLWRMRSDTILTPWNEDTTWVCMRRTRLKVTWHADGAFTVTRGTTFQKFA